MTVNYPSLHKRVYRKRGQPSFCEHCKTTTAKRFEWANISGNYENMDDYLRLCTKCHSKFDNRSTNLLFEGKFKLKEKVCELCAKTYMPIIAQQKYCGSTAKREGCSHIKSLEQKRIQYHRLKNKKHE